MHLSIFDLDGTLLKINSSFNFYLYLYRKNVFKRSSIIKLFLYYLRFKYLNMSIQDLHRKVFNRYVKGIDVTLFNAYFDKFLDKYLDKAFYLPAIKSFQEAAFNNHYILLLSSSPCFVVEPIAQILKVTEYNATKYSVNSKNKIEKIFYIMDGKQKAVEANKIMKKLNLQKENISVYSDSFSDIDLFEMAGNKIAVRPNKKLKKFAKKNNWKII